MKLVAMVEAVGNGSVTMTDRFGFHARLQIGQNIHENGLVDLSTKHSDNLPQSLKYSSSL